MTIDLIFKRIFLLDELRHGIPWDRMGWEFFFEIPWDGIERPVNPMGRCFRPIPFQ